MYSMKNFYAKGKEELVKLERKKGR